MSGVRFISKDFGPVIEDAIRRALPQVEAKREAERLEKESSSLFAGLGALAAASLARQKRAPTMADLRRQTGGMKERDDYEEAIR